MATVDVDAMVQELDETQGALLDVLDVLEAVLEREPATRDEGAVAAVARAKKALGIEV